MATYIVTFEIKEASVLQTFKSLLKNYSGYCPIHGNAWAVQTDKKAKEIREELKAVLTSLDKLFVIRSGTEAAWYNSPGEKNNEWLKKYL